MAVTADYAAAADGSLVVTTLCLQADRQARSLTAGARITGPGRLEISPGSGPAGATHWVLWVDEGYRSAVVGQPDGQGGAIWDRAAAMPRDRLAAAREVLDFNGYDLAGLRLWPAP
jgi:apolipoprotein D and lipocalin family protein